MLDRPRLEYTRRHRGRRSAAMPVMLLLALCPALLAARELGTITHNESVMPVHGSICVWDPERLALRVFLLPFEPTASEIASTLAGDTIWINRRDFPGSDQWPNVRPEAGYTLTWFEPGDVGRHDRAGLYIRAFHVDGANTNITQTFFEGERKGTLEGEVTEGGTVSLRATDSLNQDADSLQWKFEIRCEVHRSSE